MRQSDKKIWHKIIDVAGLVAIITLLVTLAQFWQSQKASISQDTAQLTQIVLLQKQLDVQQEMATLQADSSGVGPTSTVIAQRIIQLQSTSEALATAEARFKQTPKSELTFLVQADTEWANTGIGINKGETIAIEYVSGEWLGIKGGQWMDSINDCGGSFPSGLVSDAWAGALIARVGDSTPRCVDYSPFVSLDSGTLFLSFNDCPGSGCFSDNEGSISVHIKVLQ